MRFAFIGYDVFILAPQTLLEAGLTMTYAQVLEVDNLYDFNTQLQSMIGHHHTPHRYGKLTDAAVTELIATKPDFILVGGYPYKIDVAAFGQIPCMNIHPSLLPEGRGPWPFPHYILQNKTLGGVTWHLMDNKWDNGAIVLQKSFMIDPQHDNIETLYAKAQIANLDLAKQFTLKPQQLLSCAQPQKESGSYWKMPKWPEEQSFDFTMTAAEIDRIHRAFGKFGCGIQFDGQNWLVKDLCTWVEPHHFAPGTCVTTYGNDKTFAVKDGFVYLRHYQKDE